MRSAEHKSVIARSIGAYVVTDALVDFRPRRAAAADPEWLLERL
jgi:hypothetical protein